MRNEIQIVTSTKFNNDFKFDKILKIKEIINYKQINKLINSSITPENIRSIINLDNINFVDSKCQNNKDLNSQNNVNEYPLTTKKNH